MQALFLLSTDTQFSKSSKLANIDYESRFNNYKGILLQGAANSAIKAMFAHLNKWVLSTAAPPDQTLVSSVDGGQQGGSGISALLKKM